MRSISVFCMALLLSLWICPTAGANSAVRLTMETAIRRALEHNPALKAQRAELDIADAEVQTAGNRPNPKLMSDIGTAEDTYRIVGLVQTIELGGKRGKRLAVANAEKQAALAAFNTRQLQMRAETRHAYVRVYTLDRQVEGLNALLEKYRTRISEKDKIDLLKAENDYTAFSLKAVQARLQLKHLLALPLDALLSLEPPEDTIFGQDVQSLTGQALAARPELVENAQRQQVARETLRLEEARKLPDVELSVGPDLTTNPETWGVFAMANVPVPLFNNQKGAIHKAQSRQKQLETEQTALRQQIELQIAEAWIGFTGSGVIVQRYEQEILPAAESRARKDNSPQALKDYLDLQFEYMDALIEHQDAVSRLEQALGQP